MHSGANTFLRCPPDSQVQNSFPNKLSLFIANELSWDYVVVVFVYSDDNALPHSRAADRVSDRDVLADECCDCHHARHRCSRHHTLDEDQVVPPQRLLLTPLPLPLVTSEAADLWQRSNKQAFNQVFRCSYWTWQVSIQLIPRLHQRQNHSKLYDTSLVESCISLNRLNIILYSMLQAYFFVWYFHDIIDVCVEHAYNY